MARRSRSAMKALVAQMKILEPQIENRVAIAEALGCTKAQVSRGLGPKRRWRG